MLNVNQVSEVAQQIQQLEKQIEQRKHELAEIVTAKDPNAGTSLLAGVNFTPNPDSIPVHRRRGRPAGMGLDANGNFDLSRLPGRQAQVFEFFYKHPNDIWRPVEVSNSVNVPQNEMGVILKALIKKKLVTSPENRKGLYKLADAKMAHEQQVQAAQEVAQPAIEEPQAKKNTPKKKRATKKQTRKTAHK